ncbi:YueI family protein [Loigolactobacillus iwatensis]|uniref:YueI family protein n=1 Tax=Loigolactobacillus iwatensis TaxID=1267156 RepID=UPI000F7F652E|nr:YueI family protein [Loigolactobacillus iwatensis]
MAANQSNGDGVEDFLKDRMSGTPQTKPDERRRYLGSLRERVYLLATVAEINDERTLPAFKKIVPQYDTKQTKLLLNGKLDQGRLQPYLSFAAANNLPFTMISDETAQTNADAVGLLLVAPQAVNVTEVAITQYYEKPSTETNAKKRPSLLDNLFHRNDD